MKLGSVLGYGVQSVRYFLFACAFIAPSTKGHTDQVSTIGHDEEIVFFPAFAVSVKDTDMWEAEVQGCVYEREKRQLAIAALHGAIEGNDLKMTASQELVFKERIRLFMMDHERGESVIVRLGKRAYSLGKSAADGHFSKRIRFRRGDLEDQGSSNPLRFQALLRQGDTRVFSGEIQLMSSSGTIVISDIDDTIKISQVTNRHLLLKNTFLEPFQPVPGMASLYRRMAKEDSAQFWYVSASPWQLFAPLSEFAGSNGYPQGVFCLRNVRWKDRSLLSLFDSPEKHKTAAIEPLLKQFPSRIFVFVGDSGERDPEIYASLARKYPGQVQKIYIRDVTGERADAPRYRALVDYSSTVKWVVFQDPTKL